MTSRPLEVSDLSRVAPPQQPGEAVSSWLARVAQASLLTTKEISRELGQGLSDLDRGNPAGIPLAAKMLGCPPNQLTESILADLRVAPLPSGPEPPRSWSVCVRCLQQDLGEGRPPYLRALWTHPLATVCHVHRRHLVGYDASPVKIVDDTTFFGASRPPATDRDTLLEAAKFDAWPMLERVNDAISNPIGPGGLGEVLGLRCAVGDVVDALASRQDGRSTGALMTVFEEHFFGRKSLPAAFRLPNDWWCTIDAVKRLLYVRMALLILSEPPDPDLGARSPFGEDWLASRYAHARSSGWRATFAHAVVDPLIALTVELPWDAVAALGDRSVDWPSDLRRRWTYAAAAGALGTFA